MIDRPIKHVTNWLPLKDVVVGRFYWCRLARREVLVTYNSGHGCKATVWCKGQGLIQIIINDHQLCAV